MSSFKRLFLIVALLLFSSSALGLSFGQKNFEIDISGERPEITQRFELIFDTIIERRSFTDVVASNGSSISLWEAYNPEIAPLFGSSRQSIVNASFTYDQPNNELVLRYELEDSLSTKIQEDARSILWSMSGLFRNFEQGANVVIPKTTTIRIVLPFNAQVTGELARFAKLNVLTLTETTSSNFEVQYKTTKPIAPTLNAEFFQELLGSSWFQGLVAIVILLAIVSYWKRKSILKRVENYLIEHSELSSTDNPEEDELEE